MSKKHFTLKQKSVVIGISIGNNQVLYDLEQWVYDNNSIFFPLSFVHATNHLEYIINNIQPDYIIADSEFVYKWLHQKLNTNPLMMREVNIGLFSSSPIVLQNQANNNSPHPLTSYPSLQSILATSGSTSRPKLVALTKKNIDSSFREFSKTRIIQNSHNYLNTLPLYFSGGRKVHHSSVLAGKNIFYLKANQSYTNAIITHEIDFTAGTPYILNQIIKENIKLKYPLKYICGGAPLDEKTLNKAMSLNIEVFNVYGLTETTSILSYNDVNHNHSSSAGKISPLNEVKINRKNEILVRGPNVCLGYIEQVQVSKTIDNNGWLNTKDTGRIDNNGYLYLEGRSDRRAKRLDGVYFSFTELEKIIRSYLPSIQPSICVVEEYKILLIAIIQNNESLHQVEPKLLEVIKTIESEKMIQIHYYYVSYGGFLNQDQVKGNIDITSIQYKKVNQ